MRTNVIISFDSFCKVSMQDNVDNVTR